MSKDLLLTLIRHGETDGNQAMRWQGDTDVNLNENGRKQVIQVADRFKAIGYDLIMHSGMRRSYESALILGEELKIDWLKMLTALRDRSLGEIEGLSTEEIERLFSFRMTNILNERVDQIPGAETIAHLRWRVRTTRNYLLKKYAGKRVLAVSHGAFVRMFFKEFIEDPHNIRFTNCSFFTVRVEDDKTFLLEKSVEHI